MPETENHPSAEKLDENTMKRIASGTNGTYHRAASEVELSRTYTGLGRMVAWKRRPAEVSGLVSAASAVLLGDTLIRSLFRRRLD